MKKFIEFDKRSGKFIPEVRVLPTMTLWYNFYFLHEVNFVVTQVRICKYAEQIFARKAKNLPNPS